MPLECQFRMSVALVHMLEFASLVLNAENNDLRPYKQRRADAHFREEPSEGAVVGVPERNQAAGVTVRLAGAVRLEGASRSA
jgi:hypothetical protein